MECLSDLLDWKCMGMEYVKVCQLVLCWVYFDFFGGDEEEDFIFGVEQKILCLFLVFGFFCDCIGMMMLGDFVSL